MISNIFKFIARNIYRMQSHDQKASPPNNLYSIRNCHNSLICPLTENIDNKIEQKKSQTKIIKNDLELGAVDCKLCHRSIPVQNDWEEIKGSLHLNNPFIIKIGDIEADFFKESIPTMLTKIDNPFVEPHTSKTIKNVEESSEQDIVFEKIRTALIDSHSGEGYGNQKIAAEIAVKFFGKDWITKSPSTTKSEKIRNKLQFIVKDTTPDWHSNHYVIWQRFQKYANDS